MVFKYVVFAAALAYANAGLLGSSLAYSAAPAVAYSSPLAYSAPVAYSSPSIGASQQSVVRSPLGNQAVSQYTKSVDSAFSSVRKFDTRITNDALVAHATPVISSYAAPIAHAAPVVSSYAAPLAHATYAHAAPVVSSYAAPIAHATYAHAAPVLSTYAAHAPVVSAPVLRTAAVGYSPAALVSHASFTGLGATYAY